MATGDSTDLAGRIRRLLPATWFADTAPVLDAVVGGASAGLAPVYDTIETTRAQARLATASGLWLDMFSRDYFGNAWPRLPGEGDDPYRARIKWALTAPRGTRAGLIQMLTYLTGRAPRVVEPTRPGDCGAYSDARAGGYGYGAWSTRSMPAQFFVWAYRRRATTAAGGLGFYAGAGYDPAAIGILPGGYGTGTIAYVDRNSLSGSLTDAVLLQTIAQWIPSGTVAWVALSF